MVENFVQGNVHYYMQEIRQMHMDAADLHTRHDKLVHEHKALQAKYELLEAQAASLVWFIPGDVRLVEIQQMRERFKELLVEMGTRVGERVTDQLSLPPKTREEIRDGWRVTLLDEPEGEPHK